MQSALISPCIGICHIGDLDGLCSGCGRTRAEIASWSMLTVEERLRIMAMLPTRRSGRADRQDA